MKENNKYSIGEFSEKTGISIRTLHYYDEIGLLQPEKHPTSGHRIYNHPDLLTIQKIVSLKFLGYTLDNISKMLDESSFTVDLVDTLSLHLQALEEEKERINQSITTVRRVAKLLKEEGEVDSNILFTLIHGMQTEHLQNEWLDRHRLTDVAEDLSKKSEEEIIALDQTFIQLAKEVKQLFGKPVEDPKVQEMIQTYLDASFAFLGEDLMQKLADTDMEEIDIQQLEKMTPSPFTEKEEEWLNQAIQYCMEQTEMESN
ncbi:MerR family transcriptional regulator [Radiobacillus kanasensis]|uniref:MerR family transcriptional regulator n=1 Tax=Radiobacillus kanasensis TaxID=2844358 RepID=UPI001E45CDFA|nr:MerR family transcriptional regulator [Radiobacillus kanasensis]UFT99062.1 MerR family transcriptional regulator [Radiobacillus kanasensis]